MVDLAVWFGAVLGNVGVGQWFESWFRTGDGFVWWLGSWFVVLGFVDLAVGLGLFLVTWVLVSCLKVGFGWGLFGDLGADSLFVGWVDVGV